MLFEHEHDWKTASVGEESKNSCFNLEKAPGSISKMKHLEERIIMKIKVTPKQTFYFSVQDSKK